MLQAKDLSSVTVWIPLKVESEANRREHFHAVAARKKKQRATVSLYLARLKRIIRSYPSWRVRMERIGKRKLDGDNLQSGFKAIRDEIAAQIGVDDGDDRYSWEYEQVIGPSYAVRIYISRREP